MDEACVFDGRPVERRDHRRTISDVEEAFDRKLIGHEMREQERIEKMIAALKDEAFTDGPAAHRLAHQSMIDAAKAEAEFWQGLKIGIANKSIWGILQILVLLAGAGAAVKLGLWPAYMAWLTK